MKSDCLTQQEPTGMQRTESMTRKVMIVDDNTALRQTLQDILIYEGYEVDAAADGHQAVDMAANESYGLIFMDIRMPGMDGIEALGKIKAIRPDSVVVMITGSPTDGSLEVALANGAKTALIKPFAVELMIEILEEVLSETASA